MTVDAVIGNNIEELREKNLDKTNIETRKRKREREIKSWEAFWDDMIFLQNLRYIGYYDSQSSPFQALSHRIYNRKALNEDEKFYFIGFPEKAGQKTVATNRKHTGDIRILEYEWIRENCNKPFIVKVKNQLNRTQPVPNKTLQNIKNEMKTLSAKNVTHVHKYTCPTTLKTKYCNSIINKKGNKDLENSVTIMKGDQIIEDWLYQTAVGLNKCQQ